VLLLSGASTTRSLTEQERIAAGVQAFGDAGNRMTPDQMRQLLGEPAQVFRSNPRALCWSYDRPYEIRMCWGPKRKAAWISHNIPFCRFPLGRRTDLISRPEPAACLELR
jgi:hypothetical protein